MAVYNNNSPMKLNCCVNEKLVYVISSILMEKGTTIFNWCKNCEIDIKLMLKYLLILTWYLSNTLWMNLVIYTI